MHPDLSTWRPVGDSVAERLRGCPATLLIEWEIALVELREQYRTDKRETGHCCVLCGAAGRDVEKDPCEENCRSCPWVTFEVSVCSWASPPYYRRTPRRRIEEIGKWLKRIRAEVRARGI